MTRCTHQTNTSYEPSDAIYAFPVPIPLNIRVDGALTRRISQGQVSKDCTKRKLSWLPALSPTRSLFFVFVHSPAVFRSTRVCIKINISFRHKHCSNEFSACSLIGDGRPSDCFMKFANTVIHRGVLCVCDVLCAS